MKIRILGSGFYGCHIGKVLSKDGHNIQIHEIKDKIFKGASGSNPARLHQGAHYPRSKETRSLSQKNYKRFMSVYGNLTRAVPVNIYAIAKDDSFVDYANYIDSLTGEIEFIQIDNPSEFGLTNVEGAILTGERHILVNKVREYFETYFDTMILYNVKPDDFSDKDFDLTIDCTFCSLGREGVDRYEPCITFVFEGSYDKAVTIMDGQFPSFYPHYEKGNVSLTSAKYTPLGKCKTTEEAQAILDDLTNTEIIEIKSASVDLMSDYYPMFLKEYRCLDHLLAIRALPRSGADGRVYGIIQDGNTIRLRAGKIDGIFAAGDDILKMVNSTALELDNKIHPMMRGTGKV